MVGISCCQNFYILQIWWFKKRKLFSALFVLAPSALQHNFTVIFSSAVSVITQFSQFFLSLQWTVKDLGSFFCEKHSLPCLVYFFFALIYCKYSLKATSTYLRYSFTAKEVKLPSNLHSTHFNKFFCCSHTQYLERRDKIIWAAPRAAALVPTALLSSASSVRTGEMACSAPEWRGSTPGFAGLDLPLLNSFRLHGAALRGTGRTEAAAAGGECPFETWVWGTSLQPIPASDSCWNPVLLSFPGRWCCWVQAGSDGLNASGKELVPFPLLLPTHTHGTVTLFY